MQLCYEYFVGIIKFAARRQKDMKYITDGKSTKSINGVTINIDVKNLVCFVLLERLVLNAVIMTHPSLPPYTESM